MGDTRNFNGCYFFFDFFIRPKAELHILSINVFIVEGQISAHQEVGPRGTTPRRLRKWRVCCGSIAIGASNNLHDCRVNWAYAKSASFSN